jgi:VanZ family protein
MESFSRKAWLLVTVTWAAMVFNLSRMPYLSAASGRASGSYSLTDEFHQLFVPGRHASLFDCLIDTMGALMGLLLLSTVLVALRPKPAGIVTETVKSLS